MSKFLKAIFGDPNKKVLADLRAEVEKINALESEMQALSDADLKAKTVEFKKRIESGAKVDDFLHETFAVVREAAKRTLGQRHYDVQLIGGLVMFRRGIAEMRTGEGKTLTATSPLYARALEGKGCHLVTVNDYLARRDAIWMGQILHFLGLSTGCIQHEGGFVYDPEFILHEDEGSKVAKQHDKERDVVGGFKIDMDYLRPVSRKDAYAADVTYGTNNEFGFDYLRDNMAPTLEHKVQRDLHFAIVDEVDSILIDEARTPLIISAPAGEVNDLYVKFAQVMRGLKEDVDYNVDEKMRAASFTEEGMSRVEKALGVTNLYAEGLDLHYFADTALRAKALYEKDIQYVVKDDEIVIVDEFTGRMMPGRRYSEGIHQAIEAKEGVKIQRESQTLATITFQNLFRMYHVLSGMTGTAATEAEEFGKIYDLEVTSIPTHLPIQRKDLPDRVYQNEKGKYQAVIREIRERHAKGQPILVGTASIEKNELLSSLLSREGIPFNMLNAKNHESEAEFIAQAGRKGAVTIATNMAGRGVDIMLGGNPPDPARAKEVKELGGLYVLGTDRHEARRIDNQLRGRSGRQGDPGETQFYLSMEDDLMRIFASDRAKKAMELLKIPEDMPIENTMVTNAIEKAQKRVESHHFDSRKHLLEYDDVLNKHREVIYGRRNEVLEIYAAEDKTALRTRVSELVEDEIEQVVSFHTSEEVVGVLTQNGTNSKSDADQKEIVDVIATIIPLSEAQKTELRSFDVGQTKDKQKLAEARTNLIEKAMEFVRAQYDLFEEQMGGRQTMADLERAVILRAIDQLWIDHLAAMTALRTGIGLQGYGQRDPLIEYKKEAYQMFQGLLNGINQEIVYTFFKHASHAAERQQLEAQLKTSLLDRVGVQASGAIKSAVAAVKAAGSVSQTSPRTEPKVGRNDECPCGSGKKYKKCHGS